MDSSIISSLKPRKARHFPKAGAVRPVFSFSARMSPKWDCDEAWRPHWEKAWCLHPQAAVVTGPNNEATLTIGSWQKARGKRLQQRRSLCQEAQFLTFSGCTSNSTWHVHAACMRGDDWEILGVQGAWLSWTAIDCVLFFFSSTLSDERCSNLSFDNPNANPKNRTQKEQSLWDTAEMHVVCMGGDRVWTLTTQETRLSRLSTVAYRSSKLSLRRATLHIEIIPTRWITPQQSETKTTKQLSACRKHWNHIQATDRPRPDARL